MKELFVPYEITLALKELKFNKPCIALFNHGKFELASDYSDCTFKNSFHSYNYPLIAAPLWQQAIDFFRDKFNIEVGAMWLWRNISIGQSVVIGYLPYCDGTIFTSQTDTFYKARKEAVEMAIKKAKRK